ncbi:cytochrome c [Pseudomonas sp. TNT3]|uniref:cytochrome c n=1 Tax=Pseudomonas sp. TNT3 TaxID=2654097 RepID=UPI00139118B5|nr:cytochrome c [Pseudomonas sp. TNT3]KAI2674678.1 cytochrome c [Pseudomonas sp. TNT3]MBH2035032.1 cytochrome C [Pseudomonadales bacterium]MBH2078836.1 cytochrome C [Pseudomonadales bacterium]
MRSLLFLSLVCVMTAPQAYARAIPNPAQRHAPGNEEAQKPIADAGYSVGVNYQLQCAGCHLGNGMGSPANDTPRMTGFVGNFLKVPGGREFLVRVPGMSQSALNNAQLADLLNWLMRKDGMAGKSLPDDYQPYSAEEVTQLRAKTMLNLPGTRAELIKAMRAQGIAIEDGMNN